MSLRAARKLFFEYEASKFGMWHEGVYDRYCSYGVTESQESAWLAELTALQLSRLAEPGNWRAVYWLWQVERCDHLDEVLKAVPLGQLWERCAFLEEVLGYYRLCRRKRRSRAGQARVRETVLTHAIALRRRCRSAEKVARVEKIISAARRLT